VSPDEDVLVRLKTAIPFGGPPLTARVYVRCTTTRSEAPPNPTPAPQAFRGASSLRQRTYHAPGPWARAPWRPERQSPAQSRGNPPPIPRLPVRLRYDPESVNLPQRPLRPGSALRPQIAPPHIRLLVSITSVALHGRYHRWKRQQPCNGHILPGQHAFLCLAAWSIRSLLARSPSLWAESIEPAAFCRTAWVWRCVICDFAPSLLGGVAGVHPAFAIWITCRFITIGVMRRRMPPSAAGNTSKWTRPTTR
jgi:hypothetical protein